MKASLLFLLAALLLSTQISYAQGPKTIQTTGPRVVELFTSQGCSSCPPADEVLSELAKNPDIIALGFHVTYWDHLRWKDTLSQKFATDRQNGYSASAGSNKVFTPQMIINGTHSFTGSDRAALDKAMQESRAPVRLDLWKDGSFINVRLPSLQGAMPHVWFFALQSEHYQAIAAGENSGKTITYTNPVLAYRDLGEWNGQGKTISAALPKLENIGSVVILVQQNGYGPILAAGQLKL